MQHGLLQFLDLGFQLSYLTVVRFAFELLFQVKYFLVLLNQLLLQF